MEKDKIWDLVERGEIDGLTRIFFEALDRWTVVSEEPELRELVELIASREDDSVKASEASLANNAALEDVLNDNIGEPNLERSNTSSKKKLTLEDLKKKERKRLKRAEQKKKKRERWNEEVAKNNTSVYFTGIPSDATEEEVVEFFSKCGILKVDAYSGKAKVKLYRDKLGYLKGDGVVTYALQPSVENAFKVLDQTEFRFGTGTRIHLEPARFELKGEDFIPRKVPNTGKPLFSTKQLIEQKTSWNDGVDDGRGLRIVILKKVFEPKEALTDPHYYEDIRKDMLEECSKLGEIEKLTVFERNPEGVVAVRFRSPAAAESCIELMTGRWYGGRQLEAEFYDGKTDYRYKETEEERKERIKKFEEWLGEDETADDGGVSFLDAY
ncbi:HIV Tat-specific factor 1 [Galdieria sulphuraria]|nr:HIV Tat-specific factor 1 [Galdieria sulphuraria]